MKKFLLIFLLVPFFVAAQEEALRKVPKQYSLDMGYRSLTKNTFVNAANMGPSFMFDYAWQLSGLDGSRAAFITVPLGYSMFIEQGKDALNVLSYGWTVRHELVKKKKWVPFLGYGLLLNQVRQEGVDGSVFGHQTQFDFGYNYYGSYPWVPYIRVNYSLTRLPRFGDTGSGRINGVELKVGVRFGKTR